ncbi:MAG TPA: hypothetical protein VFS43_16640 [Polyangiaceae bacterium]|nr:hypothetical protein [Polyangiaceae bacterium]
MKARWATSLALGEFVLAAASWASCGGEDQPTWCDESFGYVCRAGAAGASGSGGGGGPAGASGNAGAGGASGLGGGGSGGVGGLVCNAPEIDCDGQCVDVKASDAANCGACGRSCRGSTCSAGACVPEVMATGEVAPYALAHDATHLYWASPAVKSEVGFIPRLRRVAKASAGGAAENAFGSAVVRARSLAFAGGKLYFGDLEANSVLSGTPGSLFPDSPAFAEGQLDVRHLAIAADKAFWSAGGSAAIRGKALAGGAVDPNVLGQDNPAWVAADEAGVPYWVAGVTREVRRPKASPPGYEAFATGAGVVAVELAGERVYWADAAAGVVRSAAKTDTPPAAGTVAFSGRGRVEGFRVEGTTLYVVTLEAGALEAWRKGEGDDEPFLLGKIAAKAAGYAGNPFGAAYVLVDESYLYVADVGTVDTNQVVPVSQGDGVVYRVAR